jgi:MtN3 and saliva related transmembrane protein
MGAETSTFWRVGTAARWSGCSRQAEREGGRVPENSGEYLPTIIGFVAGILSTTSFAPQAYKAWREGTQSISLRMYMITVTSFTLWTIYGLLLKSAPLIIFNALSLGMSGTILALKVRNLRHDKNASKGTR